MDATALRSSIWSIVIALCALPLLADGPQTGTIDGTVLDAQSQPLPGVTVTLSGSRGEKTVITGDDGVFRFALLEAGEYTVKAALEGLGESEATSARLETGARRTLELTLGAATEETITVTAEGNLVDRYVVGSSISLETEVAENLSFGGRQYQSSFNALPGVTHSARSRRQSDQKMAVNGGQDTEVAGMIDGVDSSFSRMNGSARTFLPTSALQEVQLESAGFSTEYGRVVGGVTNAVVKSGTNTLHGQFLYIPQSQEWRAADKNIDIPRSDSIISSFEANVGGPIAQDKAWFFAAYAELDQNRVDKITATGTPLAAGRTNEPALVKLNFQPNDRNQMRLLGIDSPTRVLAIPPTSGDNFGPFPIQLPADMVTASWGYVVSPSAFFELRVADQNNNSYTQPGTSHPIDPNASPDDPLGNNFQYFDLGARKFYNSFSSFGGSGFLELPRKQGNASMSLFRGSNEIKFGIDYQDIELTSFNSIGEKFTGRGFNNALPGGFATPLFKDVFDPADPRTTTTQVVSAYAQDRLDVGDRWTVHFGLRLDSQTADNDGGEEAVSWTKVAPRFGAVYDLKGDGRLLLKASAGRYYQIFPQVLVEVEFARAPTGTNIFDRFGWNPATQRYNIFQRRSNTVGDNAIQELDPYFKDEVTFGTQWQFSDAWVFEAQAIWWEISDLLWASDQFDAAGAIYRDVRNWDGGFRDYVGLRLEINRAFRDGWTLRTNYTLSKNEGNNFGRNDNSFHFDDDLFEGLGGIEVGTGASNATSVNRDGRGFLDRTHNLNVVALKQFTVGEQTFSIGGYLAFRSGEPWGLRQSTFVAHPQSGQRIRTTSYREPRDANKLEDTIELSLTGSWNFPITGRVQGRVAIEAVNLNNDQELVGINRANGMPIPGVTAYQMPREIRGQIGIQF